MPKLADPVLLFRTLTLPSPKLGEGVGEETRDALIRSTLTKEGPAGDPRGAFCFHPLFRVDFFLPEFYTGEPS